MGKYLDFYYKCAETGKMPDYGLCACLDSIGDNLLFHLIEPTPEDANELFRKNNSELFWGSGSSAYKLSKFTPLRQTIVLILASLNKERL